MDPITEVEIDTCLWQLDRVRDRLVLSGPYDSDLLERMRQVPGRSWDERGAYGTPKANTFALLPKAAESLLDLLSDFDVACSEAAFALLTTLLEEEPTLVIKRLVVMRDRFVIDAPFDRGLLRGARAIRGHFWDAQGNYGIPRAETFPRTYDSVVPLRRLAADFDLDIDPEAEAALTALAVEHAVHEAQAQVWHRASQATEAQLDLPDLGGTLRPFQVAGMAYAIEARRTFIADEMGLGKTVQALASLEALHAFPALVVTMASLKLNWERETRRWLPHRSVQVVTDKTCQPEAEVTIINYDVLRWLITQDEDGVEKPLWPPFQAVVLDESQAIKSPKAKRTRHALTLGAEVGVRLCLSGTPVLNRPIELVQQLTFLGRLDAFGGFWAFVERYCEAKRLAYGWDFSGASHLDELHERLRGMCYVRRTKEQVLPDLPAKQRTVVPIELSNRRTYRQAERQTIKWLARQAVQEEAFLASLAPLKRAEQKRLVEHFASSL
ncbi:MAG: SNF2-related protein [Candidatus Tectomicrobia bacterium]|nr:SNF2-related protein [Candidatus Tectomicrobia bacterium]